MVETETGLPIPLGGIAIRRDLGPETAKAVDESIRKSLEEAPRSPKATMRYVQAHAQEMAPDVIKGHIDLYVNSFSLNLSSEAEKAIDLLFTKAEQAGVIPQSAVAITAS